MPPSNTREINGVEITGTPDVGDIPIATGPKTAVWASGALSLLAGAVALAPASSTRNVIRSTTDSIELIVRAFVGQTEVMQSWRREDNSEGAFMDVNGSHDPYFYVTADGGSSAIGAHTAGSGVALGGSSYSGVGVHGESAGGHSGEFQSSSPGNSESTVIIRQRGTSTAHLLDFVDDSGTVLSYVDSLGAFSGADGFTPGAANLLHAGAWTAFTTLALAKAAAVSGDLIYGDKLFDETDVWVQGVKYYFPPGCGIVYTGASSTPIFNSTTFASTLDVDGFGTFSNNGSGAPSFGSVFNFHASGAHDIRVRAKKVSTTLAYNSPFYVEGNSDTMVDVDIQDADPGSNSPVFQCSSDGVFNLNVTNVLAGLSVLATQNGNTPTVHLRLGTYATTYVLHDCNGGVIFLEMPNGIHAGSTQIPIDSLGANCTAYMTTECLTADYSSAIRVGSGTMYLTAKRVASPGAIAAVITVGDGTLHLFGGRIEATNASGSSISVSSASGDVFIYNTVALVSGASATNSFDTGGVAATLHLLGSMFSNKAVDAATVIVGPGTHVDSNADVI